MALKKRGEYWHYRFMLNGRTHERSTELPATEANRRAAAKIEKAARLGAQMEKETVKAADEKRGFGKSAVEFLDWCETVEYRAHFTTYKRIAVSFASLIAFFRDQPVKEITGGDIERYKVHRIKVNGVKDVTLRHDLHALSLWFQYAAKMKWGTCGNPLLRGAAGVSEVSIPSDKDAVRMHPLTREEEEKYFTAAFEVADKKGRRNLYDVATMILQQGCRPEDAMSAAKEKFNAAEGTLQVWSKTPAGRRTLYLTPDCVELLAARMDTPGPWLFPSERYEGDHITKLNGSHDRACKAAGVSFVLYDLRHTFGTRQATEEKVDPFTLAAMMGHANLRTIMKYVHPDQTAQREAMKQYARSLQRGRIRRVK